MKKIKFFSFLFFLTVLFSSLTIPKKVKEGKSPEDGFALVELFTSEGCSSCPPADEVVGRLEGWKKHVYVLSFHVDYWNYLGWKDIFSNADYTERQKEYGSIFQLSSIYTPQIIVNGKSELVGSEETRLRNKIDESLNEKPAAAISMIIQKEEGSKIGISCKTDGEKHLQLYVALVQNMATSHVQRGENRGKTLTHYHIVRDFQSAPNKNGSADFHFELPAGLSSSACTLIAFLQNPKTGFILAATESPVHY